MVESSQPLELRIAYEGELYCDVNEIGIIDSPVLAWYGTSVGPDTAVEILRQVPGTGEFRALGVISGQNYYYLDVHEPLPSPAVYQVRLLDNRDIASNMVQMPLKCPYYTPTEPPSLSPTYCVQPGCSVVERQVQCFRAPCEPVIEIVCPSGVIAPPRPSYTPPLGSIRISSPRSGDSVAYGTQVPIRWEPQGRAAESKTVIIELVKNDAPGGLFTIELEALNSGEYIWDTTRILTGAFGQTIDLKQTPGDAFQIKVGIPGNSPEEYLYGQSSTFSIESGMPTPPPFDGISVGFGTDQPWLMTVPLNSPAHGVGVTFRGNPPSENLVGAQVTGISMSVQYNPQYLEPLPPISSVFTEVLEPISIRNINPDISFVSFTLGSGTTPAVINFSVSPLTLVFKPLKLGAADFIGITDVIVTTPGSSENSFSFDFNNWPNVEVEIVDEGVSQQPGDADGDGDVDIFDYNAVVSNFGTQGSSQGDLDGDGDVDIFDYNLVVSNFGA